MNEMSDVVTFIVGMVGVILLIFGIIMGINVINEHICAKTAQITEREFRYSMVVGCFYKDDNGKWVKSTEETSKSQKIYIKK
ncbi:MAG: hypothetical protein NC222_06960 [Staphylococcus sp.]|nr:hypothetical protein [Staphylococcus sp.]